MQLYLCQTSLPWITSSVMLWALVRLGNCWWLSTVRARNARVASPVHQSAKSRPPFRVMAARACAAQRSYAYPLVVLEGDGHGVEEGDRHGGNDNPAHDAKRSDERLSVHGARECSAGLRGKATSLPQSGAAQRCSALDGAQDAR